MSSGSTFSKRVNVAKLPVVMKLGVNPEQLNRKQFLELVNQLTAQDKALRSENSKFKAEL
jgi:hypothetical protein